MLALGWTNAKTAEEATYQILRLNTIALEYFIKLNDAFSSFGQSIGSLSKNRNTRALTHQKYAALEGMATTKDVEVLLIVLRAYFSDINY